MVRLRIIPDNYVKWTLHSQDEQMTFFVENRFHIRASYLVLKNYIQYSSIVACSILELIYSSGWVLWKRWYDLHVRYIGCSRETQCIQILRRLDLMKWKFDLIHKSSESIHLFSTTFRLSSNGIQIILEYIYWPWCKLKIVSGSIYSNGAWPACFGYDLFSSLFLSQPFTTHYENIQSRRKVLGVRGGQGAR